MRQQKTLCLHHPLELLPSLHLGLASWFSKKYS
jgi:hypothetical protein